MEKEYGYKRKEIAAFLEKDPASATGYLRRVEKLQSKKATRKKKS